MSDEPPSTTLQIDVSVLAEAWRRHLPQASSLVERAALAAFQAAPPERRPDIAAEISLVLADDETVQALNRDYRGHDKPTNVLSFAAMEAGATDTAGGTAILGDVVLALETILKEAAEQDKSPADHLCHLSVHGMLHLLGFDHQNDADADAMEALEIRILARLGVADPYRGDRAGAEPRP